MRIMHIDTQRTTLDVGSRLEIEDLGGANGTFLRQKPCRDPDAGNDTLHVTVRQLLARKASLAVGDCLLFGTTSVVVRRVPRVTLPDLASSDLPRPSGSTDTLVRDPAAANTPRGRGAFGWSSIYGTTFWVNPLARLSVVALTNVAGDTPFDGDFGNAIYAVTP